MEGKKTSQAQQFIRLAAGRLAGRFHSPLRTNCSLPNTTPRFQTPTLGGPMPFDCPAWPPRWPEIEDAVGRLFRSGDWGRYHAEVCAQLETCLRELFATEHVRLCCSGTAALEIALRASKIGPQDEVILAAYDYPGNFRTVELLGARPVLVDVAADSPCIDPGQVAEVAGDRVRAVIASHLYGNPAPMAELRQICDQRGWMLIEDACQAIGMEIEGRPIGHHAHVATLSFGGSKLISAGSGGALLIHAPSLGARLGPLLDRPGDVFPLAPLQAAVINPQLDRLEQMNRCRDEVARYLQRDVNPRLSQWRWMSPERDGINPAYYKVAWMAQSSEHRQQIIEASEREGLPIGSGFRTMSGCSPRRCGKPVPTPRSDELSECLFVLDQRALLLKPPQRGELGEALRRVHDLVITRI